VALGGSEDVSGVLAAPKYGLEKQPAQIPQSGLDSLGPGFGCPERVVQIVLKVPGDLLVVGLVQGVAKLHRRGGPPFLAVPQVKLNAALLIQVHDL
jgi:hypothetical protein